MLLWSAVITGIKRPHEEYEENAHGEQQEFQGQEQEQQGGHGHTSGPPASKRRRGQGPFVDLRLLLKSKVCVPP